jgi:hypothetical protein
MLAPPVIEKEEWSHMELVPDHVGSHDTDEAEVLDRLRNRLRVCHVVNKEN